MARSRYKLLGSYRTPKFRHGQRVIDQRRGEVRIVGLSAGRIPWPIGGRIGGRSLVLFGDLAQAVRRESSVAICYWFGVGQSAVRKWRRALAVPRWNEGDLLLKVAIGKSPVMKGALRAMWAKARDPGRRAKIAAARRGKPRPPEWTFRGKQHSEATKAKMRAAHRKRRAKS